MNTRTVADMKLKTTLAFRLLTALLLIVTSASHSQQTPAAKNAVNAVTCSSQPLPSAEDIRERASRLAQYRDLLNDKDQSIRLSAFITLATSSDAASQELAYEVAFNSPEISMRALALRTRLTQLSSFNLDLTDALNQDDTLRKWFPGNITYRTAGSDLQHSTVQIAGGQNSTLSAAGLQVIVNVRGVQPFCWGQLRMDESGTLAGTLSCNPVNVGTTYAVKVKSRLY
jgi:hypothetical protein